MTATATRPVNQTGYTQQTVVQPQPALDDVLKATTHRVQSIRNTAAQFLGVPPDKVCAMLRNVWTVTKGQPPLEDYELFMGMSMIARFGLDPIAREVYVTRDNKGRVMTIIGIDGWVKILDRTDHYDGFDQEYHFDEHGNMEWCETRIFSTKRAHPTVYRAFSREYARLGGFMMEKIPWHMLRLFSLHHATRLFTPIGGSVVTEDEARWMDAYGQVPEEVRTSKAEAMAAALKARHPQPPPEPESPPALDTTEAQQSPPEETAQPEPPADNSEPGKLDLYGIALDECSTLAQVGEIGTRAQADAELTGEEKTTVLGWCNDRRAAIRGTRGTRTN